MCEDDDKFAASSRRHRDPQGLAGQAEAIAGECDAVGARLGGMAQEKRLGKWAESSGQIVPAQDSIKELFA